MMGNSTVYPSRRYRVTSRTRPPGVTLRADTPMLKGQISKFRGIDALWLVFLGGLALLSPVREIHKQLTLAAIALVQIFERRLIAMFPRRGPAYSVLLKIALASLLLGHTGGGVSIN